MNQKIFLVRGGYVYRFSLASLHLLSFDAWWRQQWQPCGVHWILLEGSLCFAILCLLHPLGKHGVIRVESVNNELV